MASANSSPAGLKASLEAKQWAKKRADATRAAEAKRLARPRHYLTTHSLSSYHTFHTRPFCHRRERQAAAKARAAAEAAAAALGLGSAAEAAPVMLVSASDLPPPDAGPTPMPVHAGGKGHPNEELESPDEELESPDRPAQKPLWAGSSASKEQKVQPRQRKRWAVPQAGELVLPPSTPGPVTPPNLAAWPAPTTPPPALAPRPDAIDVGAACDQAAPAAAVAAAEAEPAQESTSAEPAQPTTPPPTWATPPKRAACIVLPTHASAAPTVPAALPCAEGSS